MGLIKKLTGQNLNNMTDEQLQQDIYPVTSIKAIYNEFNERLDCILRRQADYNLSLKKAGTTKYSEIVTYPTLSDALSIFTQGTNTYGDATYFGLQDYGTTISFLDNNLNKWRLFKFKFTGGTLTDAEWNNVSNWEELSMSSNDIDELRKLITALQNSLAETNQNVSSLSTAVTNLQVKEQELDDKKVDKYSTSHYYDITTSSYSYDLQRVVSVPTNDGTYGAVDFTFMGHSGYTEYNDLLMMSTDESEKVVSLMTDLFYTLVENINGKEYVTLCTVNKANSRNLFQFNIDLNKFGSTYNKGITTTGSDRPDVKDFIWYDNDNTDGRDLKLSDIQAAIAAGDYSKYVALKKGLVIKSSFEDTTLDSKTSCILTISSADETAKYKAADLVQYTDFIVKWDNTANKGNLSTFKMQAHTVTETDSAGNQTTSTSYYDASKIYRFSPTSNMNGFTLVGPKDPTNTAGNDSVTLLTYSNSDTKNVIPAGSIVTLTPPATSADVWLIDVKKPDVYNVDSSIDIEYDEDGRTRVSRDTLIVPFNLPEFASSVPTDLKDKYVAVLKMPYNHSTFRALIGVSIQSANYTSTEQQGGTVHVLFRRGNDLANRSHCYYYGEASAKSTSYADAAFMDRICFRFADENGAIINIEEGTMDRIVPSNAKYVYLCICFYSSQSANYVNKFQFSLDQVPYGTSYQGWDYGNMVSIGMDDYIKSYVTPFTISDVTYLVPVDMSVYKLNQISKEITTEMAGLASSKQDKLTWDTVPTKDSTNDINSGAVYTALDAITLIAGSGIQIDSNRINYKVFNNAYTVNNDNGEITLAIGTTLPVYYYSKVLTIAFKEEGFAAAYSATFIVGASNWSTVNENKLGIYQMFFSYHTESAGVDHAVMNTISGYDDKTLFAYTVDQVTKSDATESAKNGVYDIVNVYIRATIDTLVPDGSGGTKTTYQNPSTNITVLNQSFHGRLSRTTYNNIDTYYNSDYIWYGVEKDYVNANKLPNWYTSSSNTAALSLQSWTTTKPVGTYTFTKIPGYEIKDYNEQVQFKMYQFDTTPTAGSTNPVTSDGISAVLKEKCSIVSEITVAEQTNLSNPVDRGIYIIKKIDETSTTPEYGSTDSFGGSCLLPHLAIYYKDSDGVFKHTHLPIGETKSYTSITISSNILTLTKNDGSVETITLPTSTTTDHYKGQVGFSKVSSINKTTLVNEDYYLVCPDSQTSITVTSINGSLTYTTPFLMKYLKRDAISASGIAAVDGYTIMSMEPQSGGTSGSVTVYNLSCDGSTRYNSVTGTEFEIIGHRTYQGGIMIGDYSSNSSATAQYALTIGDHNVVNGAYGLAIGNTNTVNGSKSIASGYNNQVSSENSLSIGNGNIDGNSPYSFNFGSVNKMYAKYSFNFGYGNTNNSEYSFNLGYANTNNAVKSYLFGDNNTNGGEYSLLFGYYNTIASASNYGAAIGYKNTVNAVNSVAIGFQNTANYWGSSPTEASWAFGSGLTSGGNYGQFALGKYNAEIAADVAFAFGFGSSSAKKTIATIRTDGGLKLAGGLTRVPKYLSTYDLTANANKVYLSAHYEAVKITNGTTLAGVETSNGTVYSPGESVVIMGTFSYTANSVTTSVTSGAMVFVYNGSVFVKVS